MQIIQTRSISLVITLITYLFFSHVTFADDKAQAEAEAKRFNDYLKKELFSQNPLSADFLAEYKTGPWSWDVSKIVRSYPSNSEAGYSLVETIEHLMPTVYEYNRFTEEEARLDKKKADINRYYLDPESTDRVRYFIKQYTRFYFLGLRFFKLRVITYVKHGEADATIEAYLFWEHL